MSVSKPRFLRRGQASRISLWASVSSVVIILLLTGCTIGKEPKHPTWKNATGAEQYERLMWQAIRDKDWNEVQYHLAPTFVGVNAKGQSFDREGWVGYWKASPVGDFSLGEVSVQPNGPDMTVTYVIRFNSSNSGIAHRVISVWQQNKGGWTLVATSITPIQP